MVFCSSCGTANPEEAKFCAKCGHTLAVPAESQPPAQPEAPARPAAPARPEAKKTPAKQALASPGVPRPPGAKGGPDPNAPNQTQFFLAAAGVSLGSKIKRVILFILVAAVIGVGLIALIHYGFLKKEDPAEKAGKAGSPPAATQPAPAPAAPGTAPAAPDANRSDAKAKPGDAANKEKGTKKKKKSG